MDIITVYLLVIINIMADIYICTGPVNRPAQWWDFRFYRNTYHGLSWVLTDLFMMEQFHATVILIITCS